MEKIEKILKEYREKSQINVNVKKLNKTINIAKDSFFRGKENRTISYFEFLFEQANFIQKRWWILQIIILLGLWGIIYSSESGILVKRLMGILFPTFVIMIMPEVWKNKMSKSLEIEGSTYYSLRKIYSVRMILFALVDICMITVFLITVSLTAKIKLEEIVIQFFIPFNVTCAICFRTLCSKRNYTEYFAMMLAFIWIIVWGFIILQEEIYNIITMPIWIGIILFSTLYLFFTIYKLFENIETLWEEKLWS